MRGLMASAFGGKSALDRSVFNDRAFGGGEVVVGRFILSAENVVHASAVHAVVSLVADIAGSLPLRLPRVDDLKNGAKHPLEEALAYRPNPLMTGAEFWSTIAYNALLRGSSYAEPVVISANEIELWPLRPSQLTEDHAERRFSVKYRYDDSRERVFGAGTLFRCSGISSDGSYAIVPWKVARTAIEMADVLEQFGKNFFKNGARPSFALVTPGGLSQEALDQIKAGFNDNFAGYMNAGKVPILEQGLEPKAIATANTDSQYLELRRNQVREIARNWRVPLYMIGEQDVARSSEQQALDFVKYTLRPWLKRIEQSIVRDLFTPDQRKEFGAQFNLDALLRGDSATQFRNAVLARTASTHSTNELRTGWFGLPRIDEPWADDPREPLNSNRAADTTDGGMTSPQDRSDA